MKQEMMGGSGITAGPHASCVATSHGRERNHPLYVLEELTKHKKGYFFSKGKETEGMCKRSK